MVNSSSLLSASDAVARPRVRFAPSPTGYLHVGGARTALFNWLFARHFGGTLVLRIEDTDAERSTVEMVEGILQGMRWLGLDWDEGPYFQTQRTASLSRDSGHDYCWRPATPIVVSAPRKNWNAAAPPRLPTDGRRNMKALAGKFLPRKLPSAARPVKPAVVRFAVPETGGTVFEDAVFGRVEFANSELEDFVLLRSDGGPTYHLSVVTDDVDMKISHVIRGADHLSNTPKQVLLYQALNSPVPIFAHVPLILGADKTRLSKRHGATSVMAYRDEGIVPEAFRNFLALLGWTPAAGTPEIMGDGEMIRLFDLAGVSRSNAVFDRAKLDWFNTEYIRAYPAEKLLPLIEEEWNKAGVKPERTDRSWILSTIDLLKPRARSLKDFATSFRAFFTDSFHSDPAAVEKFLKDTSIRQLLVELGGRYAALPDDFTEALAEKILRDFAAERNMKAGALINGARVALTGQGVAPSLFAVMTALGKEKTALPV